MLKSHILIILTFYLFINISFCCAQEAKKLTTLEIINQNKSDSLIVSDLLDLGNYYYQNEFNLDSLLSISNRALTISKKSKTNVLTSRCYNAKAITHLIKRTLEQAKKDLDSAYRYAKKSNDNKQIISTQILIAGYYSESKEYDKSVETLMSVLKTTEENNDITNQASVYNRLIDLYGKLNNEAKIKENLDKITKIIKVHTDKVPNNIQSYVLENYVHYFEKKSRREVNSIAAQDSVKFYYNKGLAYAKEQNLIQRIASLHAVMAVYYINKDQFLEAEPFCKKALKYKPYLDKVSKYLIYSALPHISLFKRRDAEALKYVDTLLNHIPRNSITDSISAYHVAYEINFAMRNYKDAQKYQSLEKQLKDKQYNSEQAKMVEELQVKYETEKKDAQIIAQQLEKKDIENKARINYLLFGFAFLSLLIIATVFYFKNKNNNLQTRLDLEQTKAALFRSELNPNFKPNPQKSTNSKILIKSQDVSELLNINNIVRCEADGTYAKIITTTKPLLSSKNLKYYEDLLTPHNFIRVHNSHLVNVDYIQTFNRQIQDGLQLHNGDKIPVSARKKKAITDFLDALG